mmetsp:Transcript_11836/g.15833  ORF Transcript_11836/g.15833 Transcript_11836/m.15833 type:complete len:311 (+) Transcript_11836:43-975(+)
MSINSEYDEASMQLAFQQFMLQGKGPTTQQQNLQQPQTPSPSKNATKGRQLHRKYYQIFQSFCREIQDEWMDIDVQLDSVLSSILNLRLRIPKATNLLRRLEQKIEEGEMEWVAFGYRSHRGGFSTKSLNEGIGCISSSGSVTAGTLETKDVELAISHDMIQHERMLSAVRNLLANWAECQESLGRKLDNMMTCMMEVVEYYVDEAQDENDWATQQQEWMEYMTDIYQMCSMELYRKQCLCQSVLLSVGDKVLVGQEMKWGGNEQMGGVTCPHKAISKCCKEWSMSSKKSCVDMERLREMTKLANVSKGG